MAAQVCFTIADVETQRPVPGAFVICGERAEVMNADSSGRICLQVSCDRFTVKGDGYQLRSVQLAEVLTEPTVLLEPEGRELPPAIVEPWPRMQDRQALASFTTADSAALRTGERSSLRNAVQQVPGVQWDERGHGGSARMGVRGSLQRAPFGVRGLKVYWGPFPLTLADGSTPLELVDPLIVGSVDVVRSVGSPAYGTAPSGLLLATPPWRSAPGSDLSLAATGGSYGFYRLEATARTTDAHHRLSVGLLRQRNDGYRAQEWTARDQAYIATSWNMPHGITRVFLTWQHAAWALPGSLDKWTAANSPRSARPFSEQIDARLDKQQIMAGIATEVKVAGPFVVRSSVHGQGINKLNPYGTSAAASGYKDETIRSLGARLAVGGDHRIGRAALAWEAGLEALAERDRLLENAFIGTTPGPVRVDGDTWVRNLDMFATAMLRSGARTTLHTGISAERTAYDHTDGLLQREQQRTVDATPSPMVGIAHQVSRRFDAHARFATSVSRATVWELLGTAGLFNQALTAEHVTESEMGLRWNDDSAQVRITLDGYDRQVSDPITAVETQSGTAYTNAGSLRSLGAELMVQVGTRPLGAWRAMVQGAFTAQENTLTSPGYHGEAPGMAPWRTSVSADLRHRNGLMFRVTWQGLSSVRASTSSRKEVAGYAVFHARVEKLFAMRTCRFTVFLQAENVGDARYTQWVQVNDPGGRFYNPAPARSYFFGAELTFGSKKAGVAD